MPVNQLVADLIGACQPVPTNWNAKRLFERQMHARNPDAKLPRGFRSESFGRELESWTHDERREPRFRSTPPAGVHKKNASDHACLERSAANSDSTPRTMKS